MIWRLFRRKVDNEASSPRQSISAEKVVAVMSTPTRSISNVSSSAQGCQLVRIKRRRFVVISLANVAIVGTLGCWPRQPRTGKADPRSRAAETLEQSLTRGIEYLLEQQGADGGWHSPAYGAMQPGAPITANILYCLAQVPQRFTTPHRERLTSACQFLAQGIDDHGYVTNPDGSPNYPNYASAMLLIADRRLQLGLSTQHRQRLIEFLVASQLGTKHEYSSDDADYGGWDLMGWDLGPRLSAGTNVSVTRIAIEALVSERDHPGVNACLERAEVWLSRCQNFSSDQQLNTSSGLDGGFYFHPKTEHHGNKAGWMDDDRTQAISYGTATADGLHALLLLGVPRDDARVQAALNWLQQHPAIVRVPGFENTPPTAGWEQGLLFYYYASVTSAYRVVSEQSGESPMAGIPVSPHATLSESDTRDPIAIQMAVKIVQAQQLNGSWENKSNRMREDDPLIATPFALTALGNLCRE